MSSGSQKNLHIYAEAVFEGIKSDLEKLEHVKWLQRRLNDSKDYNYCDGGKEIVLTLCAIDIEKKPDEAKVCYEKFIENFSNNPYSCEIGFREVGMITASSSESYFISVTQNGTEHRVPIGYLKRKAKEFVDDGDTTRHEACENIIREHLKRCLSECEEESKKLSVQWKKQGEPYAKIIQGIFGENDEELRKYKKELILDGAWCFLMCFVYLYCLRESRVVEGLMRLLFHGSIEETIFGWADFLKSICIVVFSIFVFSFTKKVFWKTFIYQRLKQMHLYCAESKKMTKTITKLGKYFEHQEGYLQDKEKDCLSLEWEDPEYDGLSLEREGDHCYKDLERAAQLSGKRFSNRFSNCFSTKKQKGIEVDKYMKQYRNIRKGKIPILPNGFVIMIITVLVLFIM